MDQTRLSLVVPERVVAQVNINEAKTHLSRLVERAAQGEVIIIAKGGKPMAKLVPIGRELTPLTFGTMRGMIHVPDDFDESLPPDLLASSHGEE